eukprot:CFRG7312T1
MTLTSEELQHHITSAYSQGYSEALKNMRCSDRANSIETVEAYRVNNIHVTLNQTHGTELQDKFWHFSGKSRNLVCISSSNNWLKTAMTLVSMANMDDDFDLIIFDDYSKNATLKHMQEMRVKVIQPEGGTAKGLTHVWNEMYRYFKVNEQYQNLFILNNDILIGNGVVDKMAASLTPEGGGFDFVGAGTTSKGAPQRQPMQRIEAWWNLTGLEVHYVNSPLNYQKVNKAVGLSKLPVGNQSVVVMPTSGLGPLGYFMGFRRGFVTQMEYSRDTLYNPANLNAGNEDEFQSRMQSQKKWKWGMLTDGFTFHFKGSTLNSAERYHQVGDYWDQKEE